MAEETADLIEETNDDMDSWLYYSNKETKNEESNDIIDNFNATETESQLIYIDSGEFGNSNEQQTFQYDDNVDEVINNEETGPSNTDNAISEEQQPLEPEDDLSKHNLILRETIDENGQLAEGYYCQQCNLAFNTIEDFLNYHPYIELLSEHPDDQEEQQQEQQEVATTAITEDKLWDLVENIEETEDNDVDNIEEIIEMKPNCPQEENDVSNPAVELDNERYFCYDCKQVFTDLTTAENHDCSSSSTHPEQISQELIESNSTFVVENEEQNVYRCHLCDKDYTSLRSFNNHLRWHKKSEDLLGQTKTLHDVAVVCEVCNTVFASEKNLKLHMKMHKKQTVKTIQDALPVGAQNEYNELNQFFCEICNKSFDQKLLVIHKNMHQNLEEYNCGKCNKQFENLPSYEIHMQMHVVDNITNVKKSNATNTTIKQLNNFIISEEVLPSTSAQGGSTDGCGKRKHACQYCGKEFQRPYEKVKHERIHTGEKPYECEVCGKTFRVSYSLTLHLRTHTDIRPYVCATCNKRFKQQSVYVHHLKTHVVERGYKCDICGKSFRTSVQLSGHKNIHSKPYNCTECNRPFASLYSVKIHMKTHNKGHKSNKNLKNRCSICGASYARIFALRFHLKEQHGLDVHPTQLLAATGTSTTNLHKDMDAETAILMNAAHEASNQQMHFINAEEDDNEDEEDNDDGEGDDDEEDHDVERGFSNQVDHEENIQNPILAHNSYLDETEAATQTILNTQEISVDNFPTEEIITDWLSK